MSPDQLLETTIARFPALGGLALTPIYEGGSDRQFYRCQNKDGASLIAIHYNNEKAENKYYGEHALFLKNKNIHVPEVLGEVPEKNLLWLQDLGDKNLWSQRHLPWQERRALYQATLVQALHLHSIPLESTTQAGLTLQAPFDEQLYQWEQNYFIEHALGGLFNIEEQKRDSIATSKALQRLRSSLAGLPRQLVHRDLQSQNIILLDHKIYFIDFQGMRAGLAQYDLASLLYDPYVEMTSSEREKLFDFYCEEAQRHHIVLAPNFRKIFYQCAAQRLMQALGCYGFLGLRRGKPHFKKHVAPALKNLREVLGKLFSEDRLEELENLLAQLVHIK